MTTRQATTHSAWAVARGIVLIVAGAGVLWSVFRAASALLAGSAAWPTLFDAAAHVVGTALGAGTLYLLLHPQVWAIARNTMAQAIRIRAAFAIMALYLALVCALPFVVEGDGTLRGLLHVLIGYSLIAAGVLLGILTLALSTTILWSEIHEKQIFILESKPVARWQILLGKLLGILAVDAGLLAFMALVTWGSVQVHARRSRWDDIERRLAREQVLTARRVARPDAEDLSKEVDRAYEELKRRGQLPSGAPADVRDQLRDELRNLRNAIRPRARRHWRFSGLRGARRDKGNFTLRFKFSTSSRTREKPLFTGWEVGARGTRDFARYQATYPPDEVNEVQLPARLITPEGVLDVYLYNFDPGNLTLIFTGDDAVEALVPVAGFASNLARGLWLILVEVLFLAILGLCCSTFMSFPVSPVVALALYVLIYLAGTVKAEMDQGLTLIEGTKESKVAAAVETAMRGIATTVRFVLPPFDRYTASEPVSFGEEVSSKHVLEATLSIALLRGGVLVLLGILIFERRELALASR